MDNDSTTILLKQSFIAGAFRELVFKVIDDGTKEDIDLTTFQDIRWLLFPYGNPYTPSLDLEGTVLPSDTSSFNVILKSEYTKELTALYIQQVLLIDSNGKEFRPIYGQIEIITRAFEENSMFTENQKEIK